jgi:mono/diheme cytochrome c family protein
VNHSATTNNLWRFALACGLLATLAAGVLYAEFEAGYYSPSAAQQIDQRIGRALTADANYQAGAYTLYTVSLEPGDGRQEVQAYCNTCHSPSYITMQPPLPADTWAAEVKKMTTTHGASIPDDALKKIVHYLETHYTAETRKR